MDISAILAIVLIDLALSGDNALLIGMAARRLPDEQRRKAIIFGGLLAVALRIVAAAIVTLLLAIPYLQLAGGVVLAVIAYRLVRPGANDAHTGVQPAGSLREAVVTSRRRRAWGPPAARVRSGDLDPDRPVRQRHHREGARSRAASHLARRARAHLDRRRHDPRRPRGRSAPARSHRAERRARARDLRRCAGCTAIASPRHVRPNAGNDPSSCSLRFDVPNAPLRLRLSLGGETGVPDPRRQATRSVTAPRDRKKETEMKVTNHEASPSAFRYRYFDPRGRERGLWRRRHRCRERGPVGRG